MANASWDAFWIHSSVPGISALSGILTDEGLIFFREEGELHPEELDCFLDLDGGFGLPEDEGEEDNLFTDDFSIF